VYLTPEGGETGLWRHAIKRSHVHLVFALLRRNSDVLGDFEFGRRLGQMARHDHDTCDDRRDHMDARAYQHNGQDNAPPVL
jgi:hypothetical protein